MPWGIVLGSTYLNFSQTLMGWNLPHIELLGCSTRSLLLPVPSDFSVQCNSWTRPQPKTKRTKEVRLWSRNIQDKLNNWGMKMIVWVKKKGHVFCSFKWACPVPVAHQYNLSMRTDLHSPNKSWSWIFILKRNVHFVHQHQIALHKSNSTWLSLISPQLRQLKLAVWFSC